jgi:hypothetical protein
VGHEGWFGWRDGDAEAGGDAFLADVDEVETNLGAVGEGEAVLADEFGVLCGGKMRCIVHICRASATDRSGYLLRLPGNQSGKWG